MSAITIQSVQRQGPIVIVTGTVDGNPVQLTIYVSELLSLPDDTTRRNYIADKMKVTDTTTAPMPTLTGNINR